MWLRSLHRRGFTRAFTTLLAVVLCGTAVEWGHAGGDDPDCAVTFVAHDHAAHRLSATPNQRSGGEHCYICHSLRLLQTALAVRGERVVLAARSTLLRIAVGSGPATVFAVVLSSRAPPRLAL